MLYRRGEQDAPEPCIPHLEVIHAGADSLDDARAVAAEDERVLMRDHVRDPPGSDTVVDRVQSGGLHPDRDRAIGDRRNGQVGQLRLLASGRDMECLHRHRGITDGRLERVISSIPPEGAI